ncbi:mucin-5AC [Lucilia sericata]|uniref:mucin-5AC n=1 Tax=Lucilia sericata TaxID=13632 RepID=UPI0018A86C4D|nr:mucin-5AC [Lucilia sericata]
MSRRQSLDRPGILSPPGPFLTPSPSPSISASPRLQPSPSLSPFPQDVLLVTGNPLTNNSTHEQERKTVTPGRRQSIHQFTNGSPSAGTVVFQPSPSQSPAAATSVIGVTGGGGLNVVAGFPSSVSQNTITTTLPTITTTGNELNTTLVGSNNIQLNKKGTKRQQQQHQQQQQQHHQIFSSSSHYSHLPSLSTTTTIAGGYGQLHATTINNTPNTFATTTVASAPKNQTKKGATNSATVLPIGQQSQQTHQQQQLQNHHQQQQQQFQQYQTSSPLIADSPSPSPSGTAITSASIKPPTPQPPMQMLQQQFTIASNSNGTGGPQQQTFQLIQGPQGQLIAAATSQQQNSHLQQQQQLQQHRFNPTPTTNIVTSTAAAALGNKSTKTPQQILPKPQQLQQQQLIQQQQQLVDQINFAQQQQQQKSKTPNPTPPPASVTSSSNMSQPSLTQISQSAQPGQQQQIILPSGATASLTTTAQQPLLLNQMPVLVQQNTPQGVQLILRPPTPQLTATPSLVIQNRGQPQLQQHQQPQQVLRILGTNGATMQLAAATPTFIVSSQANLIQQANHLQTIKTQSQSPAITQLSGLHAALSAAAAANSQQQRSQQFATTAATINGHLLSPSVAAQIQNLQLAAAAAANGNGLTAQIQMPNGLTTSGATTLLSQLPGTAQFQQNSQGFNINLNQLSGANIQQIAAAAAAGATFQTPQPPPQTQNAANNGQQQNQQNSGNNTTANNNTATNDLFSNSSNAMSNLTQSSPAHCPVAVTPEPIRQPTPVLQNIPAASPQLQQQTHNPPQIQLSLNAAATIQLQQHQQQQQQAQIQQLQQQIQQTQNQVQQAQQQQAHQLPQVQHIQQNQNLPQTQPQVVQQETKKKPKPRKKKPPAASASSNAATANNNKSLTTTANKSLNTNTSTTSVLAPTITSTSNTINMVPNTTSQEQMNQQQQQTNTTNIPPLNHSTQNLQDNTTQVQNSPSPPPPQIQRASNGKLDLGNVMKLCGITDEDDEDFMDTSPTEETSPNQSINSTQNFTISIPQPNGTSETLPYTLSIPGVQSSNIPNDTMDSSQQEPATNIVIKIDPSEAGIGATTNSSSLAQPYSITIPRLPSQEEIQKQSQQHLNNQQNDNNTLQQKQPQTMLSSQPLNTNITFSMPMHSSASSMAPNNIPQLISNTLAPSNTINNSMVASSSMATTTTTTTTATVKPRRKPAAKRNNKKDANNVAATSINSSLGNSMNATQAVATSSTVVTPAVNITTSAISTPLATPALVPSQIGNIQISQIDNRLANNQTQLISTPMTSLVENKIQIMPIMDKNTNTTQMPQLQQTQIVFQPNNTGNNLTITSAQNQQPLPQEQPRQMQLVALPQLSNSSQASTTSTSTLNQQQQQPTLTMPSPQINTSLPNAPNNTQTPLMPPAAQTTMLPGLSGNVSISVGTPNTIAGIIPQLTGSLTLAVSEQCERLILRHDPNQPQDQQSQLILQALLKGALPNVTIINEPTKIEPPKPPTIQQQPTLPQPMLTPTSVAATSTSSANNSTGAISKSNKKNNKQNAESAKQQVTQNLANQIQKPMEGIGNNTTTSNSNLNSNLNSNINTNINMNSASSQIPPPNVTMSQQRYIALPKIDPSTQQLFSLNPLNNQITPINANQTTASIGPTERLLIAPAGINAQQLAQCLQQGQLHFNDVNPVTSQQASSTQPQQQQQQQQQQTMGAIGGGSSNQQPKQQIVYPMTSQMNTQGMVTTTTTTTTTTSNPTTVSSSAQPATTNTSTTTKQVANVAPIIDQSKAKQDTKQINNTSSGGTGAVPKKKPVRKPKASTTTAADVALMKNASVVKPMPKLDPLSQKPNNNPVQIVQPNTASGKPVVSSSTTSTTTTTTSNVVTIQPFQTQTSTGTKLVGVTAPMQQQPQNNLQQLQQQQTQQGRTQTNFSLNFPSGTNNSANTTNTTTSLNTNQSMQNLNNGLPNNSSTTGTNQPQHTVSRVQTIQLTPQQQQMFKQVQMQIQYLTVKLQHKNLLSSTSLPADLDPNVVAAFNKPMNDMEINTALQRLFMEQQRILAAGKEIPTPEPFITNANNAANAANNFPLMQSNNFTNDSGKVNSVNIPANIVLPNNHSTLSGNSNVAGNTMNSTISNIQQQQQQPTQKIHIYPIQHQQQNKQVKQTKQQQVTLNINNINSNNTNNNLATPTSTTVTSTAAGNSGNNSKITNKQKLNQNQQQQFVVQQTQNNNGNNNNMTTTTTNMANPPTLNLQLPQLSSLTTTPSLPSLPYPSLPPPHMINIANMPAVLQQKHFTQHLQMQQQQLMQQQQQQLQQKLQNSNIKPSNNFATFNANLSSMPGFQQGPPPLIFPTSTATTSSTVVSIAAATAPTTSLTTIPQLTALSQQQTTLPQQQTQTQIQFQPSSIQSAPTFAVTIGNQKTYVPIITGAIASVTTSTIQQVAVASSSSSSMNTVVSTLPQLITATAATSSTLTTTAAAAATAASSVVVATSTATMTNACSINPMLTLASSSSSGHPLNSSHVVQQNTLFNGGINVNIVGNQIAQNQTVVKTEEQISPKAKLARLSLFLRQLEVDQQSCLNPDYKSPFENKEEAVKRLIRYHCMYQPDEDIPSEEEEEFEKTAIRFQDKFRHLSGKFQQILLQESMLQHRTSEICQMETLMIEDLKQEIEDSKQLEKDILQYELLQQQQQQQEDNKETLKDMENSTVTNISQPSPCASTPSIFDQIKNEVKTELDIKLNLEEHSNNDSNSNFCNNLQSSSASLDSIKNEIKGEPGDNSLTSSSGVKSSCSSMDSFDLLKQTSVDNSSIKKQTVEVKEHKKEEISTQWKQSYLESKSSNSYYNHLASASVNINKPANHVFNGVVKKQQTTVPAAATAVATATNVELKKEEKDSFENFDIESEITPSFIMKKQEPKEPAQTTITTTTAATTTTTVATDSTINTNTNTSAAKHHSAKPAKQAKISHTFEHNINVAASITNSHNFQQTLSTTNATAQPEVVTNNFDFSHHLPVNQGTTTKQQEDDWLCIQKELNLMNSVNTTVNNKNAGTNNSAPQNTTEPLTKTLDFLSNATSNDLFPNGCINKNMENQCNNQVPTNVAATNCNSTLATSSCSQQNQQPSLPLATQEENQQAADLNEFFSGSEDSEVQKDVETRLEAMFGESPVHLTGGNKERSDSPDDIESGLESIFGESNKSPSNNPCAAKEKSNWATDFGGNSFMTTNQQHSNNFMNTTNNSMPHHIQLGSANNPRWMQNMEAQFPDFLTSNSSNNTSAVNDCMASRKRQWNGHIVDENAEHLQQQREQQQPHVSQDEESPQKKMCDGSMNNGGLNDTSASSSSPLGMQQQSQTHHHHNLVPNDTSHAQELMDAALLSLHDGLGVDNNAQENPSQTNGFAHMMGHQNFASYNNHMDNNQQQQTQHFMNLAHQQNMTAQQQQMLNNHMMQMNHQQQSNIHGHHHAGAGEFDDDITRHVQNAIDSILNLQSSEADSLSFSLDHSMGSFLGESILNDNQSGANNGVSCQESTKRRQLVDELGDCLMGNSSTETPLLMDTSATAAHSQIMNHSALHHNNLQQQHHGHVAATTNSVGQTNDSAMNNHHHSNATGGNNNISVNHNQQQQLNDFNCVVGGMDEAVKSIMTS